MSTGTATAPASAAPVPAGQLSHRRILEILTGLMLGLFLAALDQTIVASAIRTIGDDLHGLSVQAWVTTAYLITSTITTPLYGKLSDLYGRKQFFLGAISIFIAGSALCSFATSMYMLAGFRALQGVGAGGLFSMALAILGDIVPPRERARYQGYFLAVFGTSSVLGPVIGGFFAGRASILGFSGWRWVFLVNVPIGLVALTVVARTLNLPHTRRDHRLDFVGAASISVALVPLLTVAEQGRSWGWTSGRSLLCYLIGVIGLAAFIRAEARMGEDALIPLRFFRNRTFSLTSVAAVITGMGMFGGIASLPLYLQIVRGASPTQSGLQLIPLTLGIMIGSVVSGQLISRTGRYRIYPIVGSGLMVVGMLLLHFITADTAYWQTGVWMFVFGFGLGNVMQPITLAVQNAMPPQDIGVATSSSTFFRQMGGTLGVAVFLSILFSSVGDNIKNAFAASAKTPAFQAAVGNPAVQANPANKAVLTALSGQGGDVSSSAINDTSFIAHLDKALARPFEVGFATSMELVFLVAAGVLVLAFVVLFFLPELPLRTQSAMAAREPGSPVGDVPDQEAVALAATDPLADTGRPRGGVEAPPAEVTGSPSRVDGRRVGSPGASAGSITNRQWAVWGHVLRPDGSPQPEAALTLTDQAGAPVDRGSTDPTGRYRLSPPSTGTYLLVCLAAGSQPAAALVAVAGGDVRRDITLVAATRISGQVWSGNEPVPGAMVTVSDDHGEVLAAMASAPDGGYVIDDLLPGDYTVTATAPAHRPVTVLVRSLEPGLVEVHLEMTGTAEVAGMVRAASDGRVLAEATVTLVDSAGELMATGTTDSRGQYHFTDLAPGSYTVTASGYAPVTTRVDVDSGPNWLSDVVLGGEGGTSPTGGSNGSSSRPGAIRADSVR